MEQMMLTTDRLVLDTNNARKMRDKDSLVSLKASILAHGIIQPITIRPPAAADRDLEGDRYRVFAGGRRLSAVSELIFEGKLPADYELPALIKEVDDAGADEMSLAENILRRSMRPVDEFKAFSRLAKEGATADDIALRFGQSVRFVQGRMALGKLHPVLLEMLDLDEIRLDTATAYALEPDPERQLEIYNNLQGYQKTSAVYVKEAIAGTGIKSTGGVAKFIGETRYLIAGGKVMQDLFEDYSFWVSTDIVEKLKVERIAEIEEEMLAAGWAFVKTAEELGDSVWYMDTLRPEQTGLPAEQQHRLEELQAAIEEFDEVDIEELPRDEQDRYHALDEEYDELSKAATSGTAYSGSTATRSYGEAFDNYDSMSADALKTALARLVAGAVDVSQEWLSSNSSMRKATLEIFGVDPTPHFDVEAFFKAARKPIICAAYKEITGSDLKDGKKADMVAYTVDVAQKTGWLPQYLRTAAYKSGNTLTPVAEPKKPRAKKK